MLNRRRFMKHATAATGLGALPLSAWIARSGPAHAQ